MPMHHVVSARAPLGHRIFYRTFGCPPAEAKHRILFTMGLGGYTYHWEPQVNFFQKQPGYCVCVYDNRGIGFSDPVPGRWTTRDMARDALSLLNHLGWTECVHIVGLSMGGMVTQELALLDLKRFASITLISTIAGGLASLGYFARSLPSGVRLMATGILSPDPNTQLKAGLSVLFPDEFLEQTWENPDSGKEETNFVRFRRLLVKRGRQAREDGMPPQVLRTTFKQVGAVCTHRVPKASLVRMQRHFGPAALVVTGDMDILVHHGNSHVLRDGLGAELLMLEGSGHGAYEQHADEVNAAIQANLLRGEAQYRTKARL